MTSFICSIQGCHNNWKKRCQFLEEECYKPKKMKSECCGAPLNYYPPPSTEENLRIWLKAMNKKQPPKRPHVCSYHFVDRKPTVNPPNAEKWLGYETPVKQTVLVRQSGKMLPV